MPGEIIDQYADEPLCSQLAGILRRKIRSGDLGHLDPLPSETTLTQEYGVSRDTVRRAMAALSEQVERIPAASGQDGVREAWSRLTGEPSIRNVEAWLHAGDGWVITVWAQEFYRQDPLGEELRARLARALESVDRVTSVTEHDNESWRVSGTPSGEALTRAAANVVDDMDPCPRQSARFAARSVTVAGRGARSARTG
jgi:Bacterial regulatory proteins, gntR family